MTDPKTDPRTKHGDLSGLLPPREDAEFDSWLADALTGETETDRSPDTDALSRAVLTRLVTPTQTPALRLSPGGVLVGYGTLLSLGLLAGYMALPFLGISAEVVGLLSVLGDGLILSGGGW